MSRESYARGFVKAAQAMGVDPVQLVKYAADANKLTFDPKTGRYRKMTDLERSVAQEEAPIPQPEIGVSLTDTAKARANRDRRIRTRASDLSLGSVNPSTRELDAFRDSALANMSSTPYLYIGLLDALQPENWKGFSPNPAYRIGADGLNQIRVLKDFLAGKNPGTEAGKAALKALYSGHTNAVEQIRRGMLNPDVIKQ
jgi:hypothetical protein